MRGWVWSGIVVVLAWTTTASAQDWARKMFDATSHDFGMVARGSKIEHRFKIKNLYEEDVHIAAVRSSCGCTTPEVTVRTLKTFETSELVATFNTRDFLGQRSATLTITFDQPFYAETQVQIAGYVRSDVVLDPSSIEFGTVEAQSVREQRVAVSYAGRNDWRILEARSPHDYLTTQIREITRAPGQVEYELLVRLAEGAPAGYLQDYLTLVTNDSRAPEFPVAVSARIQAAVSVSPGTLVFGVLTPGQTVAKKLVVRGQTPFRIVSVDCPQAGIQCDLPEEAKTVHVLPVRLQAGDSAGDVDCQLRVVTDPSLELPAVTIRAQVVGEQTAQP